MHQARHDADSYQRVEVITGLRRRRDWSDAEKARILAESADPEVNISEVARRNGVSGGLLNVWRRKARHASSEGPQFVQVKLDDGVETRPDAMSQNSCFDQSGGRDRDCDRGRDGARPDRRRWADS